MKIIRNEKLIERNKKIGNWTSLGALAILGGGMYISFSKPELFSYSVISLIVGFMLTQVGMYMGNRFGRSPRPDEKIDAGLKGLHSEFHLYHYSTPVSHLLIGPAGIWVLLPYHQNGKVEYVNNRWKLSGGGAAQTYMKIFGQEGLGRPHKDAQGEIDTVKHSLAKNLPDQEVPEVRAVLIFTNDNIEINASDSPIQAMKLKQLKDFMRQESKSRKISSEKIIDITEIFSNE